MYRIVLAICALLIVSTPLAFAEDKPNNTKVTVDITKLDSRVRDAVLDQVKETAPVTAVTTSTVSEWAAAGKGVGEAIAAAAKALNTGVNDFIKTPAGTLVVWTIVLYLFGNKLFAIAFGPIVWAILTWLLWHSACTWFRPNVRTLKDGTVVDKTFKWPSGSEAKGFLAFAHIVIFTILSIIMLVTIFG